MKDKEALLIINPISGTRSKAGLEKLVVEKLKVANIKVTSAYTRAKGDAKELAALAAAKGFDMVISAGGDGTVNETANGVAHTPTALGIIPLGSGNGLARTLGIPQDVNEAINIIVAGHSMKCDRGMVNDHPFYCTFGVGFDAAVSEKFAMHKKRGRITYFRSVFREFLSYRSESYAISVNDKVITEKALLIAVCNASQYGNNAYIAPRAKLADGLLDITVVHSGSPLATVLMGVDLMTGSIDRNTSIDSFQTPSAVITRLSEGPVHLDGEPLIMGKRLSFHCDEGALKVMTPEKIKSFRPIISPIRAMLDDMKYDVMAKFRQ